MFFNWHFSLYLCQKRRVKVPIDISLPTLLQSTSGLHAALLSFTLRGSTSGRHLITVNMIV